MEFLISKCIQYDYNNMSNYLTCPLTQSINQSINHLTCPAHQPVSEAVERGQWPRLREVLACCSLTPNCWQTISDVRVPHPDVTALARRPCRRHLRRSGDAERHSAAHVTLPDIQRSVSELFWWSQSAPTDHNSVSDRPRQHVTLNNSFTYWICF